jgi:hypothetical protein
MDIVPYKAEHALNLDAVMEQAQYKAFMTPALALSLEGPYSRTGIIDGRVIGCAGVANRWLENWIGWAYLSRDAGRHMLEITRGVRKAIPSLPRGRIEAATPMDYVEGRRWLEMLGFKCETPAGMAHYTPDGRSFALYSMVNKP